MTKYAQHGHSGFVFAQLIFEKRKLTGKIHESILNNNCQLTAPTLVKIKLSSSKTSHVGKCSKNSQFLN